MLLGEPEVPTVAPLPWDPFPLPLRVPRTCQREVEKMAQAKPKPKVRYRVLVGVNYPPHKRAEPGDVVDDLPEAVTMAWLHEGVIERADDAPLGRPDPPAIEED